MFVILSIFTRNRTNGMGNWQVFWLAFTGGLPVPIRNSGMEKPVYWSGLQLRG
jgi:hypothetical protein